MSVQLLPFWVIIPAAGSARRMGSTAAPKQYLPLAGKTVIEHAIAPFLARSECRGVVVVLAASDEHFRGLPLARDARVTSVVGGAERADSVRAGLDALLVKAQPTDWILVHDAARPCLESRDLDTLLTSLRDDDVGGLLAAPIVDTLKRADASGRVATTVDRSNLWCALTPQMFRFDVLHRALNAAKERNAISTDDAQAIEALGLQPKLVHGSAENIKITIADDLVRAARILAARSSS